jgi:hypothetical protein
MTRITTDTPVSLDGFVTGPVPGPDHGPSTGEALLASALLHDRRFLYEETPARAPSSSTVTSSTWSTGRKAGTTRPVTAPEMSASPRSSQRSVISTSTATHLTYDVSR